MFCCNCLNLANGRDKKILISLQDEVIYETQEVILKILTLIQINQMTDTDIKASTDYYGLGEAWDSQHRHQSHYDHRCHCGRDRTTTSS